MPDSFEQWRLKSEAQLESEISAQRRRVHVEEERLRDLLVRRKTYEILDKMEGEDAG